MVGSDNSILSISDLCVSYQDNPPSVSNVSMEVAKGEIICIVGESGSGKTTLIRAVMGLLPPGGKISSGSIMFGEKDLAKASEEEMMHIRGKDIAMIFQDVGNALDPIKQIRKQYEEAILVHQKMDRSSSDALAMGMLRKMHLTDPDRVMDSYPFELSGGMKQRVGIAMGMTTQPKILLADEPTSALDVTIQAQVVRELKQLRDLYGVTIIMVTHNMGVASYISDRIGVMKNSRMVEMGPRDQIIFSPREDYTKALMEAVPKMGGKRFAR
ncbi:MAG: ABC transporter ATP-binding protein [Eubacteriales bacterium]|nr:ABC transporter ATP-binding protein [Eubacteriales bacterium]